MKKNKIQSLIVGHLLKHGQIDILLPDGVVLNIGLTQEDENGKMKIQDDYCWVVATHGSRSATIDSYNMGLRFADDEKTLIYEDSFVDETGEQVRQLEVI